VLNHQGVITNGFNLLDWDLEAFNFEMGCVA